MIQLNPSHAFNDTTDKAGVQETRELRAFVANAASAVVELQARVRALEAMLEARHMMRPGADGQPMLSRYGDPR